MSTKIETLSATEEPTVRKDTAVLVNERYKTPKTSMLIFHFEPASFKSTPLRLQQARVKHETVEGKDIYLFDKFFNESEAADFRKFTETTSFSGDIYSDHESAEKGLQPAHAMNNKEKWNFFAHPPKEIKEVYKLLGFIAEQLNADVTTLPWDLCDEHICAPAVATNRIDQFSLKSKKLGMHDDYSTDRGLVFGVPVLYQKDAPVQSKFTNGAPGKPWLVSLMLYATSSAFTPEHGMGTVFYKKTGEEVTKADCEHMRIVLFEGDIIHGIQESKLPPNKDAYRVSYVYKLIINPKNPNESMKQKFADFIKPYIKR